MARQPNGVCRTGYERHHSLPNTELQEDEESLYQVTSALASPMCLLPEFLLLVCGTRKLPLYSTKTEEWFFCFLPWTVWIHCVPLNSCLVPSHGGWYNPYVSFKSVKHFGFPEDMRFLCKCTSSALVCATVFFFFFWHLFKELLTPQGILWKISYLETVLHMSNFFPLLLFPSCKICTKLGSHFPRNSTASAACSSAEAVKCKDPVFLCMSLVMMNLRGNTGNMTYKQNSF